jgi:transcriptional regulator with XRE-family HTH domain
MKVTLHVKPLVDQRGWTVAEFAQQAGLDDATAESLYAERSTEIDLAVQSRVSTALGVLPNEILASVEEPQESAAVAPAPRTLAAPTYQQPTDELPESGVVDDPRLALRDAPERDEVRAEREKGGRAPL